MPEQALQWGADIIQGIVNGIKGAIGKVGDAVSEIAGKIKSFLGFSEPEDGPLSNFHTYMPDMIDLMAKGIRAGKDKVKEALGELTGDMSVNAQVESFIGSFGEDMAAMAGARTVSPATANSIVNSTSSRNITIYNKLRNQFNGDKAIPQQAAKTMDSSAKDVTAKLVRGLAYAG